MEDEEIEKLPRKELEEYFRVVCKELVKYHKILGHIILIAGVGEKNGELVECEGCGGLRGEKTWDKVR